MRPPATAHSVRLSAHNPDPVPMAPPRKASPAPSPAVAADAAGLDLTDSRRRAAVARLAGVPAAELHAAALHPGRLVAVTTDGRKIAVPDVTAIPGDLP